MFSSLKGILDLISLLKRFMEWLVRAEAKQEGRNEVAYDVTRETAEAENRMRDIPDATERDVVDSLQSKKF